MAQKVITQPRDFPSVEELLGTPEIAAAVARLPRPVAVEIVRATIADCKARLQKTGKPIPWPEFLSAVTNALSRQGRREVTRVINATGIVIHTNLGRAPLAPDVLDRVAGSVSRYSNLEFDLETGERGSRGAACEEYLALLSEAESGMIVNNCAAALFLILNTLAARKTVIISRGELVQIGGGFRIPDILKRAGAKLREVGTTNITTPGDYENAIDSSVGLILKVHKSNFVQAGFTQEVSLKELVALGRKHGIPVVNDLGSGVFLDTQPTLGYREPTVQQSVRDGADLTCFSGDKLLGGTQAGLIVGRSELIGKLKKNPVYRALRVDKIVFTALERLLAVYLDGRAIHEIPAWKMLTVPESELYKRGKQLLADLGTPPGVSVEATRALVGGGAMPESEIPSVALIFSSAFKAERLSRQFRDYDPPIIGRVEGDRFLLDLKAVFIDELPIILDAARTVLTAQSTPSS
ncbi:L-seryl-tRNA(Sec) selenium transferase [candidate division GN15 bacterium]|uniref:L-seryl-tRNA(Sec) selenium transferase n=1 Tax=candidate division GN15 bacterium TaxID=2072418 RepID=A0A855X2N3_9BACT|nr:MAG: L-seryl-tRNA(Sec) selenium transferase [candidate division GN15 bacterium]